jgi:hypothetical protein
VPTIPAKYLPHLNRRERRRLIPRLSRQRKAAVKIAKSIKDPARRAQLATKVAENLLTEFPIFNAEAFLKDCGFTHISDGRIDVTGTP